MPRTSTLNALNAACLVSLLAAVLAGAAVASPWAEADGTAPGPSAAIGGPSNGCIAGAEALPAQGTGFVSIRRERNRYYGHPDTIALVRDLGRALSARTDARMMVGDLSQPRGGPTPSMHRSHQNGMDVDIWFRLASARGGEGAGYPEERDPPSMVAPGGIDLNGQWGELQRFLLKATAEDPRVDRILINPAIKRALCGSEPAPRAWLRKLRPWWGHDAHFHVRLNCPAGSPLCRQQEPIPPGDGCDESLDWWFSAKARAPAKAAKGKQAPPAMPAACRDLLAGR